LKEVISEFEPGNLIIALPVTEKDCIPDWVSNLTKFCLMSPTYQGYVVVTVVEVVLVPASTLWVVVLPLLSIKYSPAS
jgi:hypothetical protein